MNRRGPGRSLFDIVPVLVAALLVGACTIAGTSGGPGAPPTEPQPTGPEVVSPIASAPTRPFRPTPAPAPTFATYVVRPGDTLIGLAKRFATTPESLAYWNRARYPSLDPDSSTYRPGRIEIGWQLLYLPDEVVDPESLPPPSPSPPVPAGPVGPYPTLPPDGSAALVVHGPTGLDGVALTFEYSGGPGEGPGGPEAIVQWLQANQVPATVFVDARAAADPTGKAVLARLAGAPAIRTGLLASAATPAGLPAALKAADAPVAGLLGRTTAPWLRPVGGEASSAARAAAGSAGWRWAIAWDVDPGDGVAPDAGGPIATDIVARVVSRSTGGAIVRLQLGGARTLEALPGLLEDLGGAGLRIVSLDEMLGLAGP